MSPPEFGSHSSNEMGFPRKNAARRARGISFEGKPFSIIRTYKIWGSSYKGSPPKIVSLRASQGFFRCAVRQHGASTKIPRSPFPREAEPGTPVPPRGKRCVLRMRSAPARASFKTLAGGAYILTKRKWDNPEKMRAPRRISFGGCPLLFNLSIQKSGVFI